MRGIDNCRETVTQTTSSNHSGMDRFPGNKQGGPGGMVTRDVFLGVWNDRRTEIDL